jgi:hypothetical protein
MEATGEVYIIRANASQLVTIRLRFLSGIRIRIIQESISPKLSYQVTSEREHGFAELLNGMLDALDGSRADGLSM